MLNALILSLFASTSLYAAQFHFSDEQQVPIQAAIFGERVLVSVDGLTPKDICTVSAALPLGDKAFRSEATFQVEGDGTIHTEHMKPISGTYSKTDADGLFWSMLLGNGDSSLQPTAYTFS